VNSVPEVVLIKFVSPDDEHDVLETCRELQVKINKFVRHVGHLPRIIKNHCFLNTLNGSWRKILIFKYVEDFYMSF
jgi:hypothetical protein